MNTFVTKCYIAGMLSIEKFCKDKKGVTAIEYAMIGVAMATLLALVLGDQNSGFLGVLKKTFDSIASAIESVTLKK